METIDDYQKGFNQGYLITQHLPDLSDQISKVESGAVRIEGFRDGRNQFVLEQVREQHPRWMNRNIKNTDQQTPPRDRDKEPDR